MRTETIKLAKGALQINADEWPWADAAIDVVSQILNDHAMLARIETSTPSTLSRPKTTANGIEMGYYKESALQGDALSEVQVVDLVIVSADPTALVSKDDLKVILNSLLTLAHANGYHDRGVALRGSSLAGDVSPANMTDLGFSIRFYKDSDWPCKEHPEMLYGQPIGMYHCPVCGEMQMAGSFHLPREFTAAETQV